MSDGESEPPRSKRLKTNEKKDSKKLIIILEECSLESAKVWIKFIIKLIDLLQVGNEHVILSSDKYAQYLRKNKKNPADYRPDILHQVKFIILCKYSFKNFFLLLFFKIIFLVFINVVG